MILHKLAVKLIETNSKSARAKLLKTVPENDLVQLAVAVKEICYSFWTSKPTKAQTSAKALKNLHQFSPQKAIKAYSEWVSGIAEITRGKLTSAIKKLDEASKSFLSLGKDYEAAQTQVSKLYALALLGKYDEAINCGENSLKIFEHYGDQLAAGKVEKNLGNAAARQGNEIVTERYYLAAMRRFVKLKNTEELTMAENSLANTYAELNNFRQAEKFYTQAFNRAKEAKMFVTEAEIEASRGKLALFRGKYDEALKFLENSRRKYETLQMPHQTAIAELEIADIYLELNLTAEAVSIYEKVVDELHKLKLQGEEAGARANFGRGAAALNQTNTARKELKKAARLYLLEKNNVGAAAVKLNEAKLELDLQNYRKALKLAQAAETLLNKTENTRQLLTVRWLQAEARRSLGESAKAQKLLEQVFTESIKQEQSNTAQAAQNSLGKLAASEKDYKRAKKHFGRAIKLIERLRAPLAAEEFRMAFLADKLAPFEHLAKIYLAENKFKQAFLTVEKARSRSLVESLGDNEFQSAGEEQNKVSAKLGRELEILREELNWFYSRVHRADEAEIEKLQTEAKKREKQIADVMRQISSTGESRFGEQNFLDFARLQTQIGRQKALLEFVNFDGVLSAFAITDQKIYFVADLAAESEILALLEDLQFQFESLRYGAKVLESFMPELKRRADFYLQRLFEKLIAPLANLLDRRDLVIVPVGALHYVPFHALFDGEKYLIETCEVTYAPGATVWQFLASKPQRKLKNALLIGYADERIPLVTREIENLGKIFADAKSFTGEQATFAAFTENAGKFDVLHLACHGQFRPENPLFSSLHLADGWITVRDVCSRKLKAEIVTLSACETGVHKIFAGDEILGLARGFLAAGASSLILSLWTVNDAATTELMKDFYTELKRGVTASQALKVAQCNFIGREVHPYFWSPFVLIGK
ncbi:MAG: CHAT domain-containing protein [Pyrinomonadaceae bacterium]|nr:CHAT domain-containing protein [Pyrinomonadaceae bacterium]